MVSPGDHGKVVLSFDEGEISFTSYSAAASHFRRLFGESEAAKREVVRQRVWIGSAILATQQAMGWGTLRRIYTDFGVGVRVGQAIVRVAKDLAGPDGHMDDEKYERASISIGVKSGEASFSQLAYRRPNTTQSAQRAAHLNPPQSPPEVGHGGTLDDDRDDDEWDPFEACVAPDELLNSGVEPGPPPGSTARFDVSAGEGGPTSPPPPPPSAPPASQPGASGAQLTFEGMFTRAAEVMQRFRDGAEGLDPQTQRLALMRAEQFAIDLEDLLSQAADAD